MDIFFIFVLKLNTKRIEAMRRMLKPETHLRHLLAIQSLIYRISDNSNRESFRYHFYTEYFDLHNIHFEYVDIKNCGADLFTYDKKSDIGYIGLRCGYGYQNVGPALKFSFNNKNVL